MLVRPRRRHRPARGKSTRVNALLGQARVDLRQGQAHSRGSHRGRPWGWRLAANAAAAGPGRGGSRSRAAAGNCRDTVRGWPARAAARIIPGHPQAAARPATRAGAARPAAQAAPEVLAGWRGHAAGRGRPYRDSSHQRRPGTRTRRCQPAAGQPQHAEAVRPGGREQQPGARPAYLPYVHQPAFRVHYAAARIVRGEIVAAGRPGRHLGFTRRYGGAFCVRERKCPWILASSGRAG